MAVNKRFRAVREHYGLNLSTFGEKIGLSASGVSSIEYGTRSMNDKHIKLICAAYPEISEEWLRTGEGDMFNPPSTDDSAIVEQLTRAYHGSPVFRALMSTYLQLDEPRRRLLEDVIEGFCAAVAEAKASGDPVPDAAAYIQERTLSESDGKAQ